MFQYPHQSSLFVRLAERLIQLDEDVEACLKRPPFIQGLYLVDKEGVPLDFEVTTYSHRLQLATRLGEFNLVFQNERTL